MSGLRWPRRSSPCRSSGTGLPSWLRVTAEVTEVRNTCVLTPNSAHKVTVVSDSPMRVVVQVNGSCLTPEIEYLVKGVGSRRWKPNPMYTNASANSREASCEVRGISPGAQNETLQLDAEWRLETSGAPFTAVDPIVLQVNTQP